MKPAILLMETQVVFSHEIFQVMLGKGPILYHLVDSIQLSHDVLSHELPPAPYIGMTRSQILQCFSPVLVQFEHTLLHCTVLGTDFLVFTDYCSVY